MPCFLSPSALNLFPREARAVGLFFQWEGGESSWGGIGMLYECHVSTTLSLATPVSLGPVAGMWEYGAASIFHKVEPGMALVATGL